jgi:hypothetical protein
MAENADGRNTQSFRNVNSTKSEDFISHQAFIEEQRSLYYTNNPFLLVDYTDQYLLHRQGKDQKIAEREERNAQQIQENEEQNEEAFPVQADMTDLMNLVNSPNDDEESDDLLEDIRKDFISPYEQETASTVMMPAADLLAQAEREAEEDVHSENSFSFDPVNTHQAQQFYTELNQVFQDIGKEWKDYSEDYDNKDANQRFDFAVIRKLESMIAQIEKLSEKSESFIRNWIQGTLFKFLDEFFILFSKVYASAYSGNMAAARVRNWLQEVLFGRLNDLFIQLQWFSIDMLLPLQCEFDPREHVMSTKQDAGREFRNYVVGIEQAGIFTYDGSTRVRKARVIMGS